MATSTFDGDVERTAVGGESVDSVNVANQPPPSWNDWHVNDAALASRPDAVR